MVKIAIWKTGHSIADTVAAAFNTQQVYNTSLIGNARFDTDANMINHFDAHLVYGILRGADKLFAKCNELEKSWFNIDRGYFNPGHFNGYYRISYKGTQAKWHDDIPKQDIEFDLEDWKPTKKGVILICPPTEAVTQFFGVSSRWISDRTIDLYRIHADNHAYVVRNKHCTGEIPWENISGVMTFNSSIGWQALQRGIPVYSDPDHSIIGSYYKAKMKNSIDFLSDEYRAIDREPLFRAMAAHQFKLSEIREGKICELLKHYLRE